MRWPWQKRDASKPEVPEPVSAEVALHTLKEAREHGGSGVLHLTGDEALIFLEAFFSDEEGGLPDVIRDFFTDPDDEATPPV